jgi:hypothetical protein
MRALDLAKREGQEAFMVGATGTAPSDACCA